VRVGSVCMYWLGVETSAVGESWLSAEGGVVSLIKRSWDLLLL